LIDYEFGPGSFSRHCERAREVNAKLEICELPSMALNIDIPEDLKKIEEELDSLEF
jgi:2-phospho-L-lactate guanylyltransferase (CobY/MobA/RfbA family)